MQLLHKSRFNGHLEHKKDSGIDFLTSLIHYCKLNKQLKK